MPAFKVAYIWRRHQDGRTFFDIDAYAAMHVGALLFLLWSGKSCRGDIPLTPSDPARGNLGDSSVLRYMPIESRAVAAEEHRILKILYSPYWDLTCSDATQQTVGGTSSNRLRRYNPTCLGLSSEHPRLPAPGDPRSSAVRQYPCPVPVRRYFKIGT